MPLSVRIYECPRCGLVIDRDHNGSQNIVAGALNAVGRLSRFIPEAPGAGAVGSRHLLDMTQFRVLAEVRDRYVNTQHPPASTVIEVRKLARDELLLEIEAVVSLPT